MCTRILFWLVWCQSVIFWLDEKYLVNDVVLFIHFSLNIEKENCFVCTPIVFMFISMRLIKIDVLLNSEQEQETLTFTHFFGLFHNDELKIFCCMFDLCMQFYQGVRLLIAKNKNKIG